jgi:hypothetical protein
VSRCSRLDFRIDEGSSSCLAAPHLLRARHARPLPLLRGFFFRFATPYSHLRLREDCGLPVLGPCLPLRFPRRPLMSITRDPTAHQLGRGLSSPNGNSVMRCTPPLCTSLPCIDLPPSSVVGHALASALPCLSCALLCSAVHALLHPRARICHTLADSLCPRFNSCSPNAREPAPSARLKPSASLLRSAHARHPRARNFPAHHRQLLLLAPSPRAAPRRSLSLCRGPRLRSSLPGRTPLGPDRALPLSCALAAPASPTPRVCLAPGPSHRHAWARQLAPLAALARPLPLAWAAAQSRTAAAPCAYRAAERWPAPAPVHRAEPGRRRACAWCCRLLPSRAPPTSAPPRRPCAGLRLPPSAPSAARARSRACCRQRLLPCCLLGPAEERARETDKDWGGRERCRRWGRKARCQKR